MRVTPLLAFVALVATSAATAGPDESSHRVTMHPERPRAPSSDHGWVKLATPTPTKFGTEYIVVGGEAGWFRTLRIEVSSGTVMVRHVRLISGDHLKKAFRVDRLLDARHPVAYIDLDALRLIDQIAVTTDRSPRGAYTLYASSRRAEPPRDVAMR